MRWEEIREKEFEINQKIDIVLMKDIYLLNFVTWVTYYIIIQFPDSGDPVTNKSPDPPRVSSVPVMVVTDDSKSNPSVKPRKDSAPPELIVQVCHCQLLEENLKFIDCAPVYSIFTNV